jgi:hypothetical protein
LAAFSQAAAVVFFPETAVAPLQWASAAYLGVDFDELPNELFEAAEFSDLAFGLFLRSRSWQRFRNGFALLFVRQARVRAMNRLARLVTATVGLAATAAGIGDRAAAEITKAGGEIPDLAKHRAWQEGLLILAYSIRADRCHKKRNCPSGNFHVAHPGACGGLPA